MVNYVPCDERDRAELIKAQPMFAELFERRIQCDCDTCEVEEGCKACMDCIHCELRSNINRIGVRPSVSKIYPKKSAFQQHLMNIKLLIGKLTSIKCPVCNGSDWEGITRLYFIGENKKYAIDMDASYCPVCGASVIEGQKAEPILIQQ